MDNPRQPVDFDKIEVRSGFVGTYGLVLLFKSAFFAIRLTRSMSLGVPREQP
jgi:hypothetical protein